MMDGFASGAASGYAHAGAGDIGEIDAEAIGAEAAEKGDRMRGAEELEAGEYEVILEEYAVAGLIEYLSFIGFSGLALEEGRSFMDLGKQVMGDERLDLGRRRRPVRAAGTDRLRGRRPQARRPDPQRRCQRRRVRRGHGSPRGHRVDGPRATRPRTSSGRWR